MAISAPTQSTQYLAQRALGVAPYATALVSAPAGVDFGVPAFVVTATLNFTAAGFTSAAAGDISLITLPPGRIVLRADLSHIKCPAGTVNSDLDIGLAAYTKLDGSSQSLQGNLLSDSLDVGGGAIDAFLNLPAAGFLALDSRTGIDVVCSFDTANSPASGALILTLVYMRLPG